MNRELALGVYDVSFHYDGEIPALEGISLEIADNAFIGIIGQNGSGKTTLVKHFNGLLKPTSGRVEVYGADTRSLSIGELARTVGYVFQNPDHQIFCPTTRQEISFGLRNLGLSPQEIARRTEDALSTFGLTPYADLPPAILGWGLRKKVAVAAIYAMAPRIFVLDEPTAGLDWRSARALMSCIQALHKAGHTIILVSHDMRLIGEYTEWIVLMNEGRILLQGTPREVFSQKILQQTQIMPPPITQLAHSLSDLGIPPDILTVDDFCRAYASVQGECS